MANQCETCVCAKAIFEGFVNCTSREHAEATGTLPDFEAYGFSVLWIIAIVAGLDYDCPQWKGEKP